MSLLIKFLCLLLVCAGLFSCAPAPLPEEEPSGPELTVGEEPIKTKGSQKGSPTEEAQTLSMEDREPVETYHQENPDWKARYDELYQFYFQKFQRPPVNIDISLKLASGREVQGKISQITDTEVLLDIDGGRVGYSADSLSPDAAAIFFRNSFAHQRALKQGRSEYNRWQQLQQTASEQPEQVAASPSGPSVENQVRKPRVRKGPAPKNEGADGHVWQVEDYIRKNAAIPDSLRIKAWGQVQPHESGYKVRVQYSLESTAGLGTSHEDMMFFITSYGRVYQRAAVK